MVSEYTSEIFSYMQSLEVSHNISNTSLQSYMVISKQQCPIPHIWIAKGNSLGLCVASSTTGSYRYTHTSILCLRPFSLPSTSSTTSSPFALYPWPSSKWWRSLASLLLASLRRLSHCLLHNFLTVLKMLTPRRRFSRWSDV